MKAKFLKRDLLGSNGGTVNPRFREFFWVRWVVFVAVDSADIFLVDGLEIVYNTCGNGNC